MATCNDLTQPFAKTICSICYEDLKPIVEDLQVISICGHVFHEICIQQLFEYPSKEKKKCPICKQMCSQSNLSRLNFQSVDDSNLSHKLQTHKEDPKELKLEARRLEREINMINSTLKSQENDLKISNEKLYKSDLERVKLQEINMALAKELAAQKLCHKELSEKCNNLVRDKARSHQDLEKAKKELEKLKENIKTANNVTCTIKEPDIYLGKTKRLRMSENLNESKNEEGVCSYILIDDDAPMASVSSPKEASLPVTNSQQAAAVDFCFSAGLVGPDGTKRHLGKWCKKGSI